MTAISSVIRRGTLRCPAAQIQYISQREVQQTIHFICFTPALLFTTHPPISGSYFFYCFFFPKIFTHEPLCVLPACILVSLMGPPCPRFKTSGELEEGAELCSNNRDANCGVIRETPRHAWQSRLISKALLSSQSARTRHEANKEYAKLTEG